MNESIVRTLSGIVYMAVLITATLFSPTSFLILFGIFLLLAALEFCNLVNLNKGLAVILSAAGFGLFAIFIAADFEKDLTLTIAALFVSLLLLYNLFSRKAPAQKDIAFKVVLLIGYVILPFLLLIRLAGITGEYNPYIILGSFIIIWTNDTFAYIVGKLFGKHKLLERISPKKTIEGFLGGLIFAILGSYILSIFYTFQSPAMWISSGVILVLFGTLGDLVESQFKRNAGVKDSGTIMPGHGGVLDRLDSIIFAIPFLFLFHQIINYVS